MAPILIDNRGMLKLGIISVFTLTIVFAVGFFNGYQRATSFYLAGSEAEVLALPVPENRQEGDLDPQFPETVVAGEEIDVDQVQLASIELQNKTDNNKTENNAEQSIVAVLDASSIDDKTVSTAKRSANKTSRVVKKPDENMRVVTDNEIVAVKVELNAIDISALSSEQINNIKYSVQAGMYGRLINAENMMKMLQVQQFDAYVSDYTNKKNETRYNVRFGYFTDKKSALAALKRFKSTQKTDGYLVKFSVESITKLAKSEAFDSEEIMEKISDENTPSDVKSIDGVEKNKISDTHHINDGHVLSVVVTNTL